MKAVVFEGTPNEVAEALKAMGVASPMSATVATLAPAAASDEQDADEGDVEEEDEDTQPLPLAVAKRILSRRPISTKLKKAMLAIHKAGDDGLLGSELCKLLDYDQSQFRGMMGAFGRRVTYTDGWEEGHGFFDQEWEDEDGYRYKLFDTSRKAVEAVLLK